MTQVVRFTLRDAQSAQTDVFIPGVGLFRRGVLDIAASDSPTIAAVHAAVPQAIQTGPLDDTIVRPPVPFGDPYPEYLKYSELLDSIHGGTDDVALALKAAFDVALIGATTDQVRALGATPVAAAPPTVTIQATGNVLANATSTVTGTLMTPFWQASTFYPAGATVLDPTTPLWALNTLVRTATGTSGSAYDTTEQGKWTVRSSSGPTGFPIRYNMARLRSTETNVPGFHPKARHVADNSETLQYAIQPQQWSLDFDWYTSAGALEVPTFGDAKLRFIVDGQYQSAVPVGNATNDFSYRYIKLSGVAAGYHRVRVEVGGSWPIIAGVKIATGDQAFPPTLPTTRSFAILGDSFGEGSAGANSSSAPVSGDPRGFAAQLARMLGFTNFYGLSRAGSGFTQPTNELYQYGIQDLVDLKPDYVLVQGSVNEWPQRATTLPTAVQSFCTQVKAANLTNTRIAISGVPTFGSTPTQADTLNDIMRPIVQAAGITWLDTTGWSRVPAAFTSSDGLHPTVAGHDYIARKYAAALGQLWGIPL